MHWHIFISRFKLRMLHAGEVIVQKATASTPDGGNGNVLDGESPDGSEKVTVQADIVIGADGSGSKTRRLLLELVRLRKPFTCITSMYCSPGGFFMSVVHACCSYLQVPLCVAQDPKSGHM